MTDSIKIAVRVRPFNANQTGQRNIVQMDGQQLKLYDPQSQQIKKFAFHRCYWSTDSSLGQAPVNNLFVFNDIGKQILGHIYQGYNSTVFAYGQTGAGKSYSIEGYQQKGILQLCLEDIFKNKIKQNQLQGITTQVRVTYLQIYNQKLRNLLNPKQTQIKVQSSGTSVVISGVTPQLCQSYQQVLKMFQDGKKIRVIGAHAMNKNSSRSHAVFTIFYKQIGKGKALQSKFNIVDLAGSQRQSKTGATGVRLTQANNINKSLTNLGIIIQTLANNCLNKKDAFVPYRNSTLTHILSQSLGGNSKTFMIAAISPASSNYQQTLSTLRFAQRASLISTQTKKNVVQKDGYNKQLLQQIQRLKRQLQSTIGKQIRITQKQIVHVQDHKKTAQLQQKINKLNKQLQDNKNAMAQLQKSLQQQRKQKKQNQQNRNQALRQAGLITDKDLIKSTLPYLYNISQDPTLAGLLTFHLKKGQTTIGTNQAQDNDIKLNSLGIMKRHCTIQNQNGKIFVTPKQDSDIYINGLIVTERKQINHLDRLSLSNLNIFKLVIPGQKQKKVQQRDKKPSGYGQYLDNKLSGSSVQIRNTITFLQELKHRVGNDKFSKFIQKYKDTDKEIDQANQYTVFRYKKYPLTSRNILFRLNAVINIQDYKQGIPSLLILCQHKQTKQVQFVWTQDKFQARLAQMQSWCDDVKGTNKNQSTYYQFDPWFDASDSFVKQKQMLQTMNSQKIYQFYSKKQIQNTQRYKQLIAQQNQLLKKLSNQFGVNAQLVQDYGDNYFRGYDINEKNKQKCEQLHKKQKAHHYIKRFMQCCAQVQKCNLDHKAYNQLKSKYTNHTNKKKQQKNNQYISNQMIQQNKFLKIKLDQLTNQFKKKVKQLNQEKNKNKRQTK